jgi:murein L,D-transpeptidase YafK
MHVSTSDRAGPEQARPFTRRRALALAAGLAVTAVARPAFATPAVLGTGPRADQILVEKGARRMHLVRGRDVLKTYRIHLGFRPEGHKLASGDGRTPEGLYWIDRRNPRSEFYLSLGISYPNEIDQARSRALGFRPGDNIFIHGEPVRASERGRRDWTAGCIAVTNREIEEIWSLVPTGTPITLRA